MDPIIVIGRQYGGNGRKIGRELASRFGVPYYDKELLSEAAQRLGMSVELFSEADERRPSPLRSLINFSYGVSDTFGFPTLGREGLYEAQSRVIRQLAAEGGCVFVGRTADYVLRNHPAMVSIFFHSPEEVRAHRLVNRGESPDVESATAKMRHADNDRQNYYNYFTGRKWGTADNYDLTLDSSQLDEQGVADMVEMFVRGVLKNRGRDDQA